MFSAHRRSPLFLSPVLRTTLKYLIIFLTLSWIFPSLALAQAQPSPAAPASNTSTADSSNLSLSVSRSVQISDKNVKDGSIVSSSQKGPALSIIPYDSQVMGVVSSNAAIVLNTSSDAGFPIVSEGPVFVLVSTKGGVIKKGDLITTSATPGVGVKATQSGYVLGAALADYTTSDPNKVDKIQVDLNLHYFNSKSTFPGSLTDILKLALITTKEGPSAFFKYLVAGLVAIGSIVLGFLSFARTAAKGVEALGRNPAASRIIHMGIIFNIAITVIIALVGLGVSFLILRLWTQYFKPLI